MTKMAKNISATISGAVKRPLQSRRANNEEYIFLKAKTCPFCIIR